MKLFTYGSLMFPEVWQRVTGLTAPGIPATLTDHSARRLRGQTYPALIRETGAVTAGVLYQNVPADAVSRLDDFEGSFYERVEVEVMLKGGNGMAAWVYRAGDPEDAGILGERWDAEEFAADHLRGFLREDAGFSESGR